MLLPRLTLTEEQVSTTELNPKNYRRISVINWLLFLPLVGLFAWPYTYLARAAGISDMLFYPGAALFAIPFMITILHGHVTVALGEAHRHHYYRWLEQQPLSYGLFFHRVMMRTRFRLLLLSVSALLFVAGWVLDL